MTPKRLSRRLVTTLIAAVATIAVVGAGCSNDDGESSGPATTTSTTTTGPAGSSSTTTSAGDGGKWARCENPDGFTIGHPAGWATNDGAVVAGCSLFDPKPFEVPKDTDARVAAITASVDPVAFSEAAAPGPGIENMRAATAVDGHQAVRISGPAGEGLYPQGTPVTRYLIDLSVGTDSGAGTLIVDNVGLADMDYDSNNRILDRMVRTIELAGPDVSASVIARYEGGGAPFSVTAAAEGANLCLTVDPGGTRRCATGPGPDAARFVDLGTDSLAVIGGTTGSNTFRMDAKTADGTLSFLPVTLPGSDEDDNGVRGGAGAWAMPISSDAVEQLTWFDMGGKRLGTRKFEDSGPDPVGSFTTGTTRSKGFPAGGPPALLTDVRVAPHDGFDRVVFEFRNDVEVSYEVATTDRVRDTSGRQVDVAGRSIIRVTMTPATGVDLSGDEAQPIYDGPTSISPSQTASVAEVAEVEDFEATLVWAIGVPNGTGHAVAVLRDPNRIVIDVGA